MMIAAAAAVVVLISLSLSLSLLSTLLRVGCLFRVGAVEGGMEEVEPIFCKTGKGNSIAHTHHAAYSVSDISQTCQ